MDEGIRCAECEVDLGDWYDLNCSGRPPARRILWQDETATRMAIAGPDARPVTRAEQLVLRWRDQRLVLDHSAGVVSMGRSDSVDISINSSFASRSHARLSYVHSCFLLSDCSANGTYVDMDNGVLYIHDDDLILRGQGCISLGRRPSASGGKLVYFNSGKAQP